MAGTAREIWAWVRCTARRLISRKSSPAFFFATSVFRYQDAPLMAAPIATTSIAIQKLRRQRKLIRGRGTGGLCQASDSEEPLASGRFRQPGLFFFTFQVGWAQEAFAPPDVNDQHVSPAYATVEDPAGRDDHLAIGTPYPELRNA